MDRPRSTGLRMHFWMVDIPGILGIILIQLITSNDADIMEA
jgi:hypothetical protein